MARRRGVTDPDRLAASRVARKVGVRVAILSAVMVVAGVLLLFSYLWVDDRQHRPHGPEGRPEPRGRALDVRLDPEDFLEIIPLVAGAAIVLAGGGAMLFARQAVKPLEASLRRQHNFVGDASHELRTPLAVLDARVQHLQLLTRDDPALQPVVAELRTDSREMAGIIDDLLAAVSDTETEFEPAPLGRAIADVLAELNIVADQRGVTLSVDGAAPEATDPLVNVPASSLRRSLLAVVDNAVGHSAPGTTVTVQSSASRGFATIRVIDQGRGITGISPDRIFERFARGAVPEGEAARRSHGIGLALVHDVATRHGGSVAVESTGPHGTTIRLRLPLASDRNVR